MAKTTGERVPPGLTADGRKWLQGPHVHSNLIAEEAFGPVTLLSSDADYVTGTTIYIDGGLMHNMGQGA